MGLGAGICFYGGRYEQCKKNTCQNHWSPDGWVRSCGVRLPEVHRQICTPTPLPSSTPVLKGIKKGAQFAAMIVTFKKTGEQIAGWRVALPPCYISVNRTDQVLWARVLTLMTCSGSHSTEEPVLTVDRAFVPRVSPIYSTTLFITASYIWILSGWYFSYSDIISNF